MIRAALLALALAGCGLAHRGEPQGPTVHPDTVAEARGKQLFARHCYQCHPGGEAGLGPALNNKPLPEVAIRTQIRKGVGAMPAFGDDVLRDPDVDAIAQYVQALRAAPATFAPPARR
jgi:mono/diheme cytochrome c family protein